MTGGLRVACAPAPLERSHTQRAMLAWRLTTFSSMSSRSKLRTNAQQRFPVAFAIAAAHEVSLGYVDANRLARSSALHQPAASLFRRRQ
jgi:hypothetical protein